MFKYEAKYDKQARAWNVVEALTDDIVGMFGGGKRGKEQAERSAYNHNRMDARCGYQQVAD